MNKKSLICQEVVLPGLPVITLEIGEFANQADGAVWLSCGDVRMLATAVTEKSSGALGFLPLSVDYQEKFAAGGRIPGGFFKREGRLSEHEVLTSRIIDRSIRPCFPKNFSDSVQINVCLYSSDANIAAEPLATLAASTALMVSPIAFHQPVATVRLAKIDNAYVVNPISSPIESRFELLVSGIDGGQTIMLEGGFPEATEAEVLAAIETAHQYIQVQCRAQRELCAKLPVEKMDCAELPEGLVEQHQIAYNHFLPELVGIVERHLPSKKERVDAFDSVRDAYIAANPSISSDESVSKIVCSAFVEAQKEAIKSVLHKTGKRLDGRHCTEIRSLSAKVDFLPSTHGAGWFERGGTGVLSTVTLGGKLDEQIINRPTYNGTQKILLHYNFPAFSTGEVRPNRGPGRREIGHGNLALRALRPLLPPEDELAYTIRLLADVISCNGSSSMATVCASSLALMDAGLPIKEAVAGIAMGLVVDKKNNFDAVLSDITSEEDALGGVDLKVAGTSKGITACQMDVKLEDGLSPAILAQAFQQAKEGRHSILQYMQQVIPATRSTCKSHAPVSEQISIPIDMIGAVIGPGGKVIQALQRNTGATVSITERETHGIVEIFAPNRPALDAALQAVRIIVFGPVVGEIYSGTVKTITDFGAFVEFVPNTDGLLHTSEMLATTEQPFGRMLEVGDKVRVKLLNSRLSKVGKREYRLSQNLDATAGDNGPNRPAPAA